MEYGTLPQFGVVYEMNHDLITHQRTIYSFLEWLSEIGGLYGAFYAIFSVLLKMTQYRAIDYYIVGQLYSRDQVINDSEPGENSDNDEDKRLDFSKVSVLKSNLVKFSPCKA